MSKSQQGESGHRREDRREVARVPEKRDATPHDETQASSEQREECGGTTMGTEIPGVQLHESQATEEALGADNRGAIQGASPGTNASDTGDKSRPYGP
jgi:hypothetical protein